MSPNIRLSILVLCLGTFFSGQIFFASAENKEELESAVQQKNAELLELQKQREAIEHELQGVSSSKQSLNKELRSIDYNIQQLNLEIKSNKITTEKLELEMNNIQSNISSMEQEIANGKETLRKLFADLQTRENEQPLISFLKHGSLAKGIEEVESIYLLNQNITTNIDKLRSLQNNLGQKLDEQQEKAEQKKMEQINLVNRQYIVSDQKSEKQRLLDITKSQEKVYESAIKSLEQRQKDIAEELEAIDAKLRSEINSGGLPTAFKGLLETPTQGTLTQGYGATKFAKYGYKGQWHNGYDIAAPIGTPIYAAEDGIVFATGDQDLYCRKGAYGKFIVIKHKNNLTTLYGHLSRIITKTGETVKRGDLIGYMGTTGYSTGSHLHFTVYASPTFYMGPSKSCGSMPFGGDLNPGLYLSL